MGIILVGGLKHSGKSTLGRLLAEKTQSLSFDMDDLILEEAGARWTSVRGIYSDLGKDEFMRLEEQAARHFVEWTLPSLSGKTAYLSLGGGTIENTAAMARLQSKGLMVYLKADEELLYTRIMAGGRPPFLSEAHPREDFSRLYKKRDQIYSDCAEITLTVDDSSAELNARRLQTALEKHHAR